MHQKILEIYPKAKPPNFDKWTNQIRLMREQDGRTLEEIRELFAWANADSFWQVNIRGPDKLRNQWEQLDMKRGNTQPQSMASKIPTPEDLANWTPQ